MSALHLNRWFFIVAVLALSVGCSKNTDTPEAVVKAYYQAAAKSNLLHTINEKNEVELLGDASEVFALYDFEGFSPEDLAIVKNRVAYEAFDNKRTFNREGGLEKIEVLGIEKTGQNAEGWFSQVKFRLVFKNGKTKEGYNMAYQRGKEYKLVFPKEILAIIKNPF